MARPAAVPFLTQFAALRDPRQAAKVLYPLPELLLVLLCGTVAGADDLVELTLWGEEHLAFLRRFLPFARGIPSHDTLCEVIAAIDPDLFKTCFSNWVERLRMTGPDMIAIDGKTSRRSHARSNGRGPLHTVSLGLRANNSCWDKRRCPRSPMRSSPFRCCCDGWNWPAPSSLSTPSARRRRSHR